MTECTCAKLKELTQSLLRETETCVAALPSVMPPSNLSAVLSIVKSNEGVPALFLYSLNTEADGLSLRDVLPLSSRILKFSARKGGETKQTAVTVTIKRVTDGAQLVFATLSTPDANAEAQMTSLNPVVEACQKDTEVTEAAFGWVRRYKRMVFSDGNESEGKDGDGAPAGAAAAAAEGESKPEEGKIKIEKKEVTIMFATWNVNGKMPPASLDEWLIRDGAAAVKPDIYCIGFQELDLSASALVLGDSVKAEPWENCIASTLSKHGDYVKLATKLLVGIFLCVFVRRDVQKYITDVQSDLMPVGILGVMGNKGGVAVRFNINDSTFCIVNSHLNAHMENVTRRNQDYHDIERELVFFVDGKRASVWDHDFLFWIGDLNYRINCSDQEVRSKLKAGDIASLLPLDQLQQQQKARLAFEPFSEAPITFQPTYKYDTNSTEYDTSQNHRCPAWCDRVLYHLSDEMTESEEPDLVTNVDYMRHELLISDHRPVSALYRIKTRVGLAEAKKKMMKHRMREMDSFENQSIPDLKFSTNELDFGLVHYSETVPRKLVLRNTGSVVANWRFEKKPGETTPFKPWIKVEPCNGTLAPEEQASLIVTVSINRNFAHLLSGGSGNSLDEILVLHLDGGKDYFLALSGQYVRSCFGMTIPQLVTFDQPVRNSLPAGERRLWVPKELWRLVDHLMTCVGEDGKLGIDTPGIFASEQGAGHVEEDIELMQKCLDTGESFAMHDFPAANVAACIVRFLDNLGQPIVSAELYPRLMQCTSLTEAKALLGSQLDDENYTTFFYLLSFMRTVLSHSKENGLTPEHLAAVFAPVLLRSPHDLVENHAGMSTPSSSSATTAEQREVSNFIYRFLSDIGSNQPQ